MKGKTPIFLLLSLFILVACSSEEDKPDSQARQYESTYLEEHRENARDFEDIYDQELFIDNEILEQLYDEILKTSRYDEKLIEYKVSEYAYGNFKNNYDIVSHYKESEEKLDSNLYNPLSGKKTVETILRGDTIFQRSEETGIVDETSFYKDDYDDNYFYILGLDPDLDTNFTRMMYFLVDGDVQKSSTEPDSSYYEISLTNVDKFKDYLLTDENDDYIQHFSTINVDDLQGVDVTYQSSANGGTLRMKLFLDSGEYELIKKLSRGRDLHFRNMENMEPARIDLKR